MKQTCITTLRNKNATAEQYRGAADRLATALAVESTSFLSKEPVDVETPLAHTQGTRFKQEILLVPILRSGLIFLSPFLHIYPEAKVGFLGMRRNEVTAIPEKYYQNIPKIHQNQTIFLLDPMIATGGSASLAVKLLKEAGAKESQIALIAFIAAPEGLAAFKKSCPSVQLTVAQIDESLNKNKFIVPGLGDFGDRYFGTVS